MSKDEADLNAVQHSRSVPANTETSTDNDWTEPGISGAQPEMWPSETFTNQIGTLRALLHILRGFDALKSEDPRDAEDHFHAARRRAEDLVCWPLLKLCAELNKLMGLEESRKTKPDSKFIAACQAEADSIYTEKSRHDVGDPGRWLPFASTFEALRLAVKVQLHSGARSKKHKDQDHAADPASVSKDPLRKDTSKVSLASRRNQQIRLLEENSEINPLTGPDTPSPSACWSTPVGPSVEDELGSNFGSSDFGETITKSPGDEASEDAEDRPPSAEE